jgi:hypothetical protein
MTQAILHLTEEFISEDLDYYFSGERDKNNQIRPDDNIVSMTPASDQLSFGIGGDKAGNFFFPTSPNILDRIYIGTSIPLFANNWGASFLLQLLKVLKPGGAVILPVYPEGQAQEKGYWSRSFLENVFLSRQRWTGFSNVRAENDGVMSLRVGRKWPDPIPGTIEWFYQQRANMMLEDLLVSGGSHGIQDIYTSLIDNVWKNYTNSAVIERIILDHFGAKTSVTIQNLTNDYGLLITDLLLSPYVSVVKGVTYETSVEQENVAKNFHHYFSPYTKDRHIIIAYDINNSVSDAKSDVVCVFNSLNGTSDSDQVMLNAALEQVKPDGLLVVYEDLGANHQTISAENLDKILEQYGAVQFYSSIVASKIHENIEISHYSTVQESHLVKEKRDKTKVFRVINKADS